MPESSIAVIMLLWIVVGIVMTLLVVILLGYQRVHPARKISIEGIENREAVQAYNRVNRWPQFKLLRRMVIRELKRHHPQGVIMDIGCGPGYLITSMAKSFPDLHIIGLDVSEEMLQLAHDNIEQQGLTGNIILSQGDIKELPFENASIDFIISTASMHHWLHPDMAIQEIYRVLKPGGQFLIFDVRRDSHRSFYWLLRFTTRFIVPAFLRQVKEPLGSALAGYTPEEVDNMLTKTPFQQWQIKPGFGWLFIWGEKPVPD